MRVWCLMMGALVLGGCERDNGAFCDATHPCATGTCDTAANHCVADGSHPDLAAPDAASGDLAGTDLTPACGKCGAATPLCMGGTCVGCDTVADGEGACLAASPTTPHCMSSGAGHGACAGCRDGNDCSVPGARICDATLHTCRGCAADAECPSLVCDLTQGSANKGQCVDPGKVVYVDTIATCDDAKGDTPAMPMCSITKAAMRANKTVVRLANTLFTENVMINNIGPLTVVGDPGATVRPGGMNMPALTVKGTSTVTVRSVIFTGGLGTGPGILCMNATLAVDRCILKTNEGYGIDANTCASLKVDASTLTGNLQGGLRVGGDYDVSNSFLVKNGGAAGGSAGGINIQSPNTAVTHNFTNNTVADNSASGLYAGVFLGAGVTATLVNCILYNNKFGAIVSETMATTLYCATDDAVDAGRANSHNVDLSAKAAGFQSTSDYHLVATSPCRSVGTSSGAPDHDVDGQPRPDPVSAKIDVGADQYYP